MSDTADRTRAALPSPYPDPEPGVYRNLPDAVYHRDPRWAPLFSSSKAKTILRSPRKLRWEMDHAGDKEATPAMLYGTALHTAILEPDRLDDDVVWAPFDKYPGKNAWAKFVDEHSGQTILKPWTKDHDRDKFDAIVAEVRGHETASAWLDGDHELTIVADVDGVRCKVRVDALPLIGGPVDLKTTADAYPSGFGRTAYSLGYHVQAALYRRVVVLACEAGWLPEVDPERFCNTFRWVVVEQHACPELSCFDLGEQEFHGGEAAVDNALGRWIVCNETNHWPGYSREPKTLMYPRWAMVELGHLVDEEIDADVEF